jgi:hypothetical protein
MINNDIYIEFELEKALMNERDRHFIFKLEESILQLNDYKRGILV